MANREFRDASGVSWRVWNTVPISGAVISSGGFDKGWLTFESDSGLLRRLVPIPPQWEDAAPERLDLWCRNATEVPRHTGPFKRVSNADANVDSVERE